MQRSMLMIFGLLVLVVVNGCSGDATAEPPTTPEADSGARVLSIPQAGPATPTGVGSIAWDLPGGWTQEPPSSSMRQVQYSVPGSAGLGECVVFYFGPGQGGEPMANAERWAGQFSQPDGVDSLARMEVQEIDGGSLPLLLVEVTGTYEGGMSMGTAAAEVQPNSMLLGGIATGPDAPWFFKFTGPEATVRENRDAFVAMLRSIRQEI